MFPFPLKSASFKCLLQSHTKVIQLTSHWSELSYLAILSMWSWEIGSPASEVCFSKVLVDYYCNPRMMKGSNIQKEESPKILLLASGSPPGSD